MTKLQMSNQQHAGALNSFGNLLIEGFKTEGLDEQGCK